MRKISIIILFCLTNIACSQLDNNFRNKKYAVYIEARTEDEFVTSGEFGDIFLLNLSDNSKLRITNDKFYDYEPSISRDGNKIIYMSNRYYGDSDPRFIGVGPLGGIYIHNLENNEVSDVTDMLRKDKKEIIKVFRWGKDDGSIFFLRNGSEIIEYDFNSNDKRIVYSVPSPEIYFYDFLISPNLNTVIIKQGYKKDSKNQILIYNYEYDEEVEIDSSKFVRLYSTYNDTSFLFYTGGKVYLYNLVENTIEYLIDDHIKGNVFVEQCFRLDYNSFLILGRIADKRWLLKYDITTNDIEYITDGNKDIQFLDVYLGEKD